MKEQAEWRKSEEYPVNAWRKHKLEWADFLADYYISYDSLYHHGQPDFEVLSHLHQQNRLGQFNLGYYDHVGPNPEDLEKWKAATLPRLREAYSKAKQLGLLDHAYIYGCDEAPKELFPQVCRPESAVSASGPRQSPPCSNPTVTSVPTFRAKGPLVFPLSSCNVNSCAQQATDRQTSEIEAASNFIMPSGIGMTVRERCAGVKRLGVTGVRNLIGNLIGSLTD